MCLLKSKDQAFQNFQQFHAMVERETGRPLKSLRIDIGGEYIYREFREYCSKHGIRHEKTDGLRHPSTQWCSRKNESHHRRES